MSLPVHFLSLCPSCQSFLSSARRQRRFCVLFSRVWMFLQQTHPGTSFCPLCVILAHLYSLCVDVDVCTVKTKCASLTQVDKMVCHGYTCGCVEFDLTHQYGLTWHAILSTCSTWFYCLCMQCFFNTFFLIFVYCFQSFVIDVILCKCKSGFEMLENQKEVPKWS